MRDPDLRRSVLFVPGADGDAHQRALNAAPDVLVQDLEDFTPQALRPDARRLSSPLFEACRERALLAAVRINRLDEGGRTDLEAVVRAAPDLVLLPKCAGAADVVELEAALAVLEERHGLEPGGIEIVPNVETAAGLVALDGILAASVRVRSALLAAEDLATDLQAERQADGEELVAKADGMMREEGILDPVRFAHMLAPLPPVRSLPRWVSTGSKRSCSPTRSWP